MEKNKELELALSSLIGQLHLEKEVSLAVSQNEQFESFVRYIENLISNDFDKLVSILYRVDVSEHKVRDVLSENSKEPAGRIIANLILKREAEKEVWRKKYSQE